MRIAIVITSLFQGGAERVVFETALELTRQQHQVCVIPLIAGGQFEAALEAENIPVYPLNITSKFAPLALLRLLRRLREFKPDLVHAHLFHADLATRLARILSFQPWKLVSHQHIVDLRNLTVRRLLEKITRSLPDQYICVSNSVADHASKISGLDRSHYKVIENGRNLTEFLQIPLPEPVPLKSPKLGTVGRLNAQKDHVLLLRAFAALLKSHPQATLELAGDGPERSKLESLTQQLNLGENVVFRGLVKDIPDFLESIDLFVMSSEYEGFAIALIEAMAAARPIVATEVPGITDVLNKDCGDLIPYGNPETLAQGLRDLIENPKRRVSLASAARQYAVQNLTLEIMTRNTLNCFESVLKRP